MLTVGAMGSGSSQYYSSLAQEDYFLKSQEPSGIWLGSGAEKLGLTGIVKSEEFKNLFQGFSADGKTKLVQNAGKMKGDFSRDPGWDLTFSAPKSVSIVWAIADPEVKQIIERAHLEAIKAIIPQIEKETVIRKGKGGVIREQAELVFAAYQHSTARAIDKKTLPDMELHTHCLAMNLGVSPTDGKTRAIKSQQFFDNKVNWGTDYRAEFARNLNALGFETVKTEHGFELKVVEPELIKHFSKRTEQIKEQTKGMTDPREIERTKLFGRQTKDSYSREELFSYWTKEVEKHGLSFEKVLTSLYEPKEERSIEIEKREATKEAVKNLSEAQPCFTKDELQREIAKEAVSRGIGFREIIEATKDYLKSEAIYIGQKDGKDLYTNDRAAEIATKREIENLKKEEEQKHANLRAYKEDLEEQGYKVLICAYTREKADTLEKETGIRSATVRKTIKEFEGKGLTNYEVTIRRMQGQKAFTNEEREKNELKRKVVAEFKYATHQISKETKDKMVGEYHKPTNRLIHEFKYATWQISKNHRDYLNYQLYKERFNVDEKTVVILDARFSEKFKEQVKLKEEIEKRGAKLITSYEAIKEQKKAREIEKEQEKGVKLETQQAQEQEQTFQLQLRR